MRTRERITRDDNVRSARAEAGRSGGEVEMELMLGLLLLVTPLRAGTHGDGDGRDAADLAQRTAGLERRDGFLPFYWDARGASCCWRWRAGRGAPLQRRPGRRGGRARGRLDRGEHRRPGAVRFERIGPRAPAPPAPDQHRSGVADPRARARGGGVLSLRRCWRRCRSWPRTASACWSTPPTSCCRTPRSLRAACKPGRAGRLAAGRGPLRAAPRAQRRVPAQHRDRGAADLHLRRAAAPGSPTSCPTGAR